MTKDSFSLDGLDGYMFEELVAKVMKRAGYVNVQVTQKSGDTGKDILMEDKNGNTIIVECKHQSSVGRPVVQKLQGAMIHESGIRKNSKISGMIVTSGKFSNEAIEYVSAIQAHQEVVLMDGRALKKYCENLGLVITNGRVQIISNRSYKNISIDESVNYIKSCYAKIYGNSFLPADINADFAYDPLCVINYRVSFDTYTSIGLVDSYSNAGKILINGVSGKFVRDNFFDLYASEQIVSEEINVSHANKIRQYEFTENDLEDRIFGEVIRSSTHTVRYTGGNNVTYYKECMPLKKDISLNLKSLYAPIWSAQIKLGSFVYSQKFAVNSNKKSVLLDELLACKLCDAKHNDHSSMFLCHECGRVVCQNHKKIDYLDKTTPVCEVHYKKQKVLIQTKYFAKEETKIKYKEWLDSKNFLVKIYEDKYILLALLFAITVGVLSQLPIFKQIDVIDRTKISENTVPVQPNPIQSVIPAPVASAAPESTKAENENPSPSLPALEQVVKEAEQKPSETAPVPTAPALSRSSTQLWEPSFDCYKTITDTEKVICSDARLSVLDKLMEYQYNSKLRSSNDREGLKIEQSNWRNFERNSCKESVPCISDVYKLKLDGLAISDVMGFMKLNGWVLDLELWKIPNSCTQKFIHDKAEMTIVYRCAGSSFADLEL